MRTKGAKTTKNCWSVKISQGDIILHDKQYKTLREAGDDMGLTYSQICELGPNGRNKKKSIRFKYMPNIVIEKIGAIKQDTEYIETQEKIEDPDYIPNISADDKK